jgi:hypothetical protein
MVKYGPFWASIGSVYESAVIEANQKATPGQTRYVAIYPKATFTSNMRALLPNAPWVSPQEREAAQHVNYSQLKQGAFSSPAVSKPTASLWGGLQHPQSTVTSALNNRFWCPQYNYNLKQLKLLKELSSLH